jgi:hypothetical protein
MSDDTPNDETTGKGDEHAEKQGQRPEDENKPDPADNAPSE